MTDPSTPLPPSRTGANARAEARAQARRERMRKVRRQRLAALALLAVVGLVIALSSGGSPHGRSGGTGKAARTSGRQTAQQQVAAGAVATAGRQPGASVAYAAAGKRAGLPGDILIADRGNDRVLLVNAARRVLWRFPTAADLAKGRRLVFDDDTFVAPGGRTVVANEEDNQVIVSIGVASHRLQVLFGHPGVKGAGTTHLNTPDDAYPLADGSITVADAYNCRILFIRNHRVIRRYGSASRCRHDPPRSFGAVNGDAPTPDGGILISEIPGHWVDWINRNGRLRFAVRAPVSYPSDPQPLPRDRILLADYANPGQVLIITRRGKVLWRYRKRTGYGRLDHPSLALSLPNGNIAVNDDYRHRVVVINPKTKRIVWQYGRTDVAGTGANRLRIPDGTDFVPTTRNGHPGWADVVHP